MDSVHKFELQIRYTHVDRQKDSIIFTDYDFQVDENMYFYPASTVKFPIAVLALEKLNETDSLFIKTRFYIEGDSVETTFAEEINKIFAVSDNEANNRLVEFLGQDAINQQLKKKGIFPVRISHRLSTPEADEITTKPLIIYLNDSTTATLEPSINTAPEKLSLHGITKGIGFYDGDSIVNEPFDFSLKNYYPITAQHAVLKRVIFPKSFSENQRFNISDLQRNSLLLAMKSVPRKLGYNADEYYDSYGKFFIYGDSKENIPEHVEIYNKVGYAYGTLTDCAYINDSNNNVEFMLTASLLVNKNGIFNDDTYEFEEVGIPFLAQLGREIYAYELGLKQH